MASAVNWGDARLPQRFWDKVSPCPITGCWWWTGLCQMTDGGPQILWNGKNASARRVSYLTYRGTIGSHQRVGGKCNTLCCNPAHLVARDPVSTQRKLERQRERNRIWNALNHESKRNSVLKRKYGMSVDDYKAMVVAQGNACAVCRRAFESERKIRVDHDHETGRVRGLLCHSCNVGIGLLGDTADAIAVAAEYLRKHESECRR